MMRELQVQLFCCWGLEGLFLEKFFHACINLKFLILLWWGGGGGVLCNLEQHMDLCTIILEHWNMVSCHLHTFTCYFYCLDATCVLNDRPIMNDEKKMSWWKKSFKLLLSQDPQSICIYNTVGQPTCIIYVSKSIPDFPSLTRKRQILFLVNLAKTITYIGQKQPKQHYRQSTANNVIHTLYLYLAASFCGVLCRLLNYRLHKHASCYTLLHSPSEKVGLLIAILQYQSSAGQSDSYWAINLIPKMVAHTI